ncbi:MAG: four helix bundle protein [Oscillospiraceae bacterium]|nr:four helix bundle protein [Oscillospiraceae bacterium]
MTENKLVDSSMDLAIKVIKLCENIKGHYSIVNQLERSTTSIGANIREGNYAQSKADFISKFQIALKEANETEYWLELFYNADLTSEENVKPIIHDCGVIRRMLIASINTAKSRM